MTEGDTHVTEAIADAEEMRGDEESKKVQADQTSLGADSRSIVKK